MHKSSKSAHRKSPKRPRKRPAVILVAIRRTVDRPLPEDLPRKYVEHDVPSEQKICSECGCDKKCIGEETSEQSEYVPASLYVIKPVCPKYACPQCQGRVV